MHRKVRGASKTGRNPHNHTLQTESGPEGRTAQRGVLSTSQGGSAITPSVRGRTSRLREVRTSKRRETARFCNPQYWKNRRNIPPVRAGEQVVKKDFDTTLASCAHRPDPGRNLAASRVTL